MRLSLDCAGLLVRERARAVDEAVSERGRSWVVRWGHNIRTHWGAHIEDEGQGGTEKRDKVENMLMAKE